ncbi:hypothetical protein [Streptomyces sp. NPDC006309]|uniref:hypothetical protein n=1 Tax=Streptomyces sp. NPDC006309 TaxID=3156749 RepID=UPI0033A32B33
MNARAVAVVAPTAGEPVTGLAEPASGGHTGVRTAGPSGTLADSAPCVRIASPGHGPGLPDVPAARRVPRDAGDAVRPPRDDSSVAVLTPDLRTDVHDRNP